MSWTRLGVSLVLVALALLAGLSIASCRTGDVGLVDGRLKPCPSSPNCVSSEDPGSEAFVQPLAFTGDPGAALERLVEFLRAEPRVQLELVEQDYVHAVFKTRLLRFRDDVEFRLDAEASLIHVRSASRLGYSDLGANRARIESIRERWEGHAMPGISR